MLSNAALPMQPSRFWLALSNLFSSTGHGSATYTVGPDRQFIHDQTLLTFVIGPKETPEAFFDRVRGPAEPGDVVEFTTRAGLLTSAKVTRQADVPIRMGGDETLESFVARVKTFKGAIPQA